MNQAEAGPPARPTRQESELWRRVRISSISWVGWGLIWIINRTLRFETQGDASWQELKRRGSPVIYSFWHNQIFTATYYFRFRGIVVITSRHFDGEAIARIIERFGYGTARGSSTRGALRALLELKQEVARGRDAAFTVDGPRGPRYQVKPGPLWLSRRAQIPIVPFHIEPERFWQLKSWDKFRIPKPFSRIHVRFGAPIQVPSDAADQAWLPSYQAEMDRIRQLAEGRFKQ